MWPIFRFLMSTHMVPFAVYSAFETSQFHVQDGGSRASTTPKFAPKPGENGAKIESFPVFCFERLDRIAGGLLRLVEILDFILFQRPRGVNSYAKYGKEVDFPISFKNLRGPVAGNKLQRCALLSCQSDTLYFITRQGFIQQT